MIENKCPHCHELLDDYTAIESNIDVPKEGDFSVCFECGEILRFGPELKLYSASQQDIDELMLKQPETYNMLVTAQKEIRKRRLAIRN